MAKVNFLNQSESFMSESSLYYLGSNEKKIRERSEQDLGKVC